MICVVNRAVCRIETNTGAYVVRLGFMRIDNDEHRSSAQCMDTIAEWVITMSIHEERLHDLIQLADEIVPVCHVSLVALDKASANMRCSPRPAGTMNTHGMPAPLV